MAFLALTTGYTCSPTSSLCSFSAYVFPFATGCPVSHVSHQLNCSVLTIRFPTLSTGYMFPMLAISYMFPGIMLWPMNGIFHKFWPKLLTLYRVDHYFFKGGGGEEGWGGGISQKSSCTENTAEKLSKRFLLSGPVFHFKKFLYTFLPTKQNHAKLTGEKKIMPQKTAQPPSPQKWSVPSYLKLIIKLHRVNFCFAACDGSCSSATDTSSRKARKAYIPIEKKRLGQSAD